MQKRPSQIDTCFGVSYSHLFSKYHRSSQMKYCMKYEFRSFCYFYPGPWENLLTSNASLPIISGKKECEWVYGHCECWEDGGEEE